MGKQACYTKRPHVVASVFTLSTLAYSWFLAFSRRCMDRCNSYRSVQTVLHPEVVCRGA